VIHVTRSIVSGSELLGGGMPRLGELIGLEKRRVNGVSHVKECPLVGLVLFESVEMDD